MIVLTYAIAFLTPGLDATGGRGPREPARKIDDAEHREIAEGIVGKCPLPPTRDEASRAEDCQLLRDIGLGSAQGGGEVADAGFTPAKNCNNGQPRRMGERPREPCLFVERDIRHRGNSVSHSRICMNTVHRSGLYPHQAATRLPMRRSWVQSPPRRITVQAWPP